MIMPKVWIGVLFMFVLLTATFNGIEGNAMTTNTDVSSLRGFVPSQITTATETSTGTAQTTADTEVNIWDKIYQAAFFDYTIFYDVRYDVATESDCTACSGYWQSATSTCKVPNDWMILRYLLICLGIVWLMDFALFLKSLFKPT